MHYRAASIHLLPGTRLRYNHAFNDLSVALLRHASRTTKQPSSALQDGERNDLEAATADQMRTNSGNIRGKREIFIDDLAATLEAHRASNRANIIRKIDRPPPKYQDWKRLTDITDRTKVYKKTVQEIEDAGGTSTSATVAKPRKEMILRPKTEDRGPLKQISRKMKHISQEIKRLQKDFLLLTTTNEVREEWENGSKHKARVPGAQRHSSQPRSSPNNVSSDRPWLAYVASIHEDRLEQSALPPTIPMLVV